MADKLTPEQRSELMRRVKREDTEPEMAVRRAAHAMGYRFRLHCAELTGRPDLVFPSRRTIVFVHGCFWHGHDCKRGTLPKSRTDYWKSKIERNRRRDADNVAALRESGWKVFVIWECETRNLEQLRWRIAELLDDSTSRNGTSPP